MSNERRCIFVGDSKKVLSDFPKDVKISMGHALSVAQSGGKAAYAKPMPSIGAGVLEIVVEFDTNAYRVVYAVKLGDDLYVLHAFNKKSKSGISTPKHEIEIIKNRLKAVKSQRKG